jgi:hypothetical protein
MILTNRDMLLGHQTTGSYAEAGQGDARFTERFWYTAHPVDGSAMILDTGLGYYPNRGVMDAFAGITIGRRQFNFRASRQLGDRPLDAAVGPLNFDIDLRTGVHHLTLTPNASGISFDLYFEPSFPAAREKQSFRERKGQVEEDLARSSQFGRWRGWFVVDGQRHELNPAQWWGQRDRSWGLRSRMSTDVDTPPVQAAANFFWTWSMLQMRDSAVALFLKERDPAAPFYLSCHEFQRGTDGQVTVRDGKSVRHEFVWADDPLGQTIKSADLVVEFEHGPHRELHLEALPARFYLKGGLYGGYRGWNQGDDRGPYYEEHDIWDLNDPTTRQRARTLGDHVVRVTSGTDSGIGISEYGVAEGYPRYPEPQKFPVF